MHCHENCNPKIRVQRWPMAKGQGRRERMNMSSVKLPHDHGEEYDIEALKEQAAELEPFQTVGGIFRQLSDPSRVRIFWVLCHCEECVINLSAMVGMTSPAVSHHLKSLKDCGLIVSRREGKEVYYRASDTEVCRALHEMTEKMMSITCPR